MRLVVLLLSALCGGAFAQTNQYRVIIQGRIVGKATISRTTDAKGNSTVQTRMNVDLGEVKSFMNSDETVRVNGTPVETKIHQLMPYGDEKIVRTYAPMGLIEKRTLNGKVTTKHFPYPTGSIRDPMWFVKGKPKAGQKDRSWSFDGTTHTWRQDHKTYLGLKDVALNGQKVRAHLIRSKLSDIWVDDKGQPYRIVMKGLSFSLTLERT